MPIYDVYGRLLTSGGNEVEIKEYYEAEMEDTISKVRALQTEPNLTFFYITDIHAYDDLITDDNIKTLYKISIENMRYLLKEVPCDGIVNLGDSIDGYESSDFAKKVGNDISNEFRKIGIPYYSVIGNHDDNRYFGNTFNNQNLFLSTAEQYQLFVNPTRRVVSDMTGLNYYIDFPEFQIRMICINGVADNTYKFTNDTCTWFSEVALNTPDKYGILVNTHISPVGAWNYGGNTPINANNILSAIDSYSSKNDILGIICGHNHVDAMFSNPYPGATLCCELFQNGNGDPSKWPAGAVKPAKKVGTATEDCWTVAVIRPYSRKINFVRFGAGNDYEISYESHLADNTPYSFAYAITSQEKDSIVDDVVEALPTWTGGNY